MAVTRSNNALELANNKISYGVPFVADLANFGPSDLQLVRDANVQNMNKNLLIVVDFCSNL